MFKRVIMFLALKVVEVAAAFLVVIKFPSWLGGWIHSWTGWWCANCQENNCAPNWIIGFSGVTFVVAVTICTGLIIIGLDALITKNWEWAGKIANEY